MLTAAGMGTMSSEPDFAPLRARLVALRLQAVVALAEQPQDGALDARLLALVANVQSVLVAIEEMTGAERPRPAPCPARRGVR